jgi:eukaryotic-like serine/threonine-protein kinase
VWARTGQELFYLDGSNAMTAVPIQTSPTFTLGNPMKLFEGQYYAAALPGRTYDVSPDSKRFLMIKDPPRTASSAPVQLVLVLNWTEELSRVVPKK